MLEIATEICNKFSISPDTQLKKAIRGLNGFTAYDLIYALLSTTSITEAAALLGYTDNPVKVAIRQLLHEYFPARSHKFSDGTVGTRTWRNTLLASIGKKWCSGCSTVKPFDGFHKNMANLDGYSSTCSKCKVSDSKLHKLYIIERTPSWADMNSIKEFYANCPDGYHVDHILPLRGNNISGLHVLANLQYLKAEDNMKKGNKVL